MIDYRGVDKQDVIKSLKQAEAFLRHLDLGPATTQMLDDWLAKDPYTKIQAATDRKALAQVMKGTGSDRLYIRSWEIFRHHALDNTKGVGKKVFEDVCVWGGFSGSMTLDYRPTNAEQDAHLISEYEKILHIHGIDSKQFDRGRGKKEPLFDAVLNVPGMASKLKDLKTAQPFTRYGIAVDHLPNDFKSMGIILEPLIQRMNAALAPFSDTYEVHMTGIGSITDDWKKSGIIFVATKPAAQAVADQMPQCEVIDHTGKRVTPSAKPIAPAPARKSRPPQR